LTLIKLSMRGVITNLYTAQATNNRVFRFFRLFRTT
jgi:hypothetical protein